MHSILVNLYYVQFTLFFDCTVYLLYIKYMDKEVSPLWCNLPQKMSKHGTAYYIECSPYTYVSMYAYYHMYMVLKKGWLTHAITHTRMCCINVCAVTADIHTSMHTYIITLLSMYAQRKQAAINNVFYVRVYIHSTHVRTYVHTYMKF
jgi:hypothetical protein